MITVVIDPFLTDENIDNIRRNVNYLMQNNKYSALKTYHYNFAKPDLFYKNPDFTNKQDAIEKMTINAIAHGFAYDSLTMNVLQRESLSDTGFNGIAIPHSLCEDVLTGFLSFAICDTPTQWGEKYVYIVLLICVNKYSRKVFTEVFDVLVEVLSEIQNIKELAAATDYDEFLKKLIILMKNVS